MTRRRKPRLPTYPTPLPCALLAVDPGYVSGWAIMRAGHLLDFGEVDAFDPEALSVVVRQALRAAHEAGVPLVMVREEWGTGGARGLAQWGGLFAARKVWDATLERLRDTHDQVATPKTMGAHISTWRSRVLGTSRVSKAEAKRLALVQARRRFPTQTCSGLADENHNAAEAICIGVYAQHAGELGKLLPKRWLKSHGLTRPLEAA